MLLLGQLLHQFHRHLITQGIAYDDHLLHCAVTLSAVEVLLPSQCHAFESLSFLLYAGQPFQIHHIGHLGILLVQLPLGLVNDSLDRYVQRNQFMIRLQRTAVEHIHEVVFVNILLDVIFGCVKFQCADTLGLIVVESHLFHQPHHGQHRAANGHLQ